MWCRSPKLNDDGMVIDFAKLKKRIHGVLDHKHINDVIPFNPTAEHLAEWVGKTVGPKCFKVEVQESEGNIAIWEEL